MASSTLIQKLDRVSDPLVSGTVGSVSNTIDRSQSEWFLTASAISIGDWVQFDVALAGLSTTDRVLFVKSAAIVATGNPLTCGVALTSTPATGGRVQVVIGGLAPVAKVAAGTAQGAPLSSATAVIATATTNVAANIAPICGVALEAEAAGVAPVWVIKNF